MPQYEFAGLKAGDKWCLCAARWQEAFNANCAPTSSAHRATNQACLAAIIKLEDLNARIASPNRHARLSCPGEVLHSCTACWLFELEFVDDSG